MRSRTDLGLILLASCGLLVSACGNVSDSDPADPEATAQRINDLLPGIYDSTTDSTTFASESASLGAAFNAFGTMSTLVLPTEPTPASLPQQEEPPLDGQGLAQFLIERIFNAQSYEGDGVFLIQGELWCVDDLDPVACADAIDAIEIRILVELAGGGLNFTMMIGPDRHAPFVLELRPNSVALVANFAAIAAAAVHLNNIGGGEPLDLPDTIEGVVAGRLTVDGPQAITLDVAIRADVNIADGGSFSLSSAATDPLWSLSLDAAAQSAGFLLGVGNTVICVPYNQVNELTTSTDNYCIDLKGMTADIQVAEGDTQLTIDGMSLGSGESTIALGADKLLGVTLPSFSVTADPIAETLSFAPDFDLTIAANLQPLADLGEDVAGFLLDDTYNLTITDTISATPATATSDGAIRVDAGELTLSATSDGSTVTVSAGECLVGVAVPPAGSHELLGHLAAGACP